MIIASEGNIGQKYKTASGIVVEIIEKKEVAVVVKSGDTGNKVNIPLSYPLEPVGEVVISEPCKITNFKEEKAMSETLTPAVEAPKGRKVKKSNIVDEGLKAGLSVEEITKNVLAVFPETQEKSVRNLVSVRRSKFKKTV